MVKQFIGTGQDQVPVNGMLGDLAFQSKESVKFTDGEGSLSALTLNPVYKQIAQSAVDVFVYDTSKDSDGGAWRKRCQTLSWFNETLNTTTRGSRKEFPAVALLVVTANTLVIYDADEATLPMWMVFNTGSYNVLYLPAGGTITSVCALNGVIAVGKISHHLSTINFLLDSGMIWATDQTWNMSNANIQQRNAGVGVGTKYSSNVMTGSTITDVSMTVTQNSLIDPAMQLPVPTIVAATNSGVNVIKSDGSIVSWTAGANHSKVKLAGNNMYVTYGGNGRVYVDPIPGTNVTYGSISGSSLRQYRDSDNWSEGWQYDGNALFYKGPITPATDVTPIANGAAIATTQGLSIVAENASSPSNSMIAYATTQYNTGWMHGNIKGAWLSDTVQGVPVSTNYVTNPDFSSNTSGWSAFNCTLSTSASQLVCTSSSTGLYGVTQTIGGLIVGKQYYYAADLFSAGASPSVRIQISGIGAIHSSCINTVSGTGRRVFDTFTATSTSHTIEIFDYGTHTTGTTMLVDNVHFGFAEADRSVGGLGLQPFGTILKTPIAAGSDLVSYSGFSTSNYLQQNYTSSLDFGTTDFCIVGWARRSSTSLQALFERGTSGTSAGDNSFAAAFSNDGTLYFQTHSTAADYLRTANSGIVSPLNTWINFVMTRTSSGIRLYQNGVLISSASGAAKNVTNSNAILIIGKTTLNTLPFSGDLALLRISATVPSEDQIRKIYNDEKQLFQDNAKCTLYGASDSVTALAYDEDAQLLHVGTSAGRSVFQGLRRVDNTTTAVTASISASNGLVAEQ